MSRDMRHTDTFDVNVPYWLQDVDTSTVVGKDTDGRELKALKLHLMVVKQNNPTEQEGIQLPPVWMDATTALALIRALHAKLETEFPAEVAADRMASTTRQ